MEFRKNSVVPERSLLDGGEQGGKHQPPGYPFNLLPLNLNLNLAGNPPCRSTVFVFLAFASNLQPQTLSL